MGGWKDVLEKQSKRETKLINEKSKQRWVETVEAARVFENQLKMEEHEKNQETIITY